MTAMLERRDGILQVTLHTNGKELEWGGGPHEELSYLFADIARDFENKVVILTGTGECFCANPPLTGSANLKSSAWDRVYNEGKHLLMNHLNIEVPMIAAVNGPAHRHAELAVCAISCWPPSTPRSRIPRISPTAQCPAMACTSCGRWCSALIEGATSF